jgi:hypothetical protein
MTTIRMDEELLTKAHELGLNVSKIAENALKDAINRMQSSYPQETPKIGSETQPKEIVVARERFELSSSGPKPDMLDHYTNGLHGFN